MPKRLQRNILIRGQGIIPQYCGLSKTNLHIKKMFSANNQTSACRSTSHKVTKRATAECIKLRKLHSYFGTVDDSQKLMFLLSGTLSLPLVSYKSLDPFQNLHLIC